MEENETPLSNLSDTLETIVTSIPAPIRKSFFKAFDQLCSAALDIPTSWLQGYADMHRANTEARKNIILKISENLNNNIDVPEAYSQKAIERYASKIIKQQINTDRIFQIAATELVNTSNHSTNSNEINEEWLNEFEEISKVKTSKDMQILFGKILANEIKNPGQFTLKTLRTISLMDKKVAQIFAKFCRNCFYVLDSNKNVYFGIVIDPKSKRMSPPSLEQYDINTYEMTFLEDYGLVLSSDDLALNFASTIPGNNLNYDSLIYFDRKQVIIENNNINENILEVGGKILTKAGSELFQALKVESDYKSYDNLKNYFAERNIKMYLK